MPTEAQKTQYKKTWREKNRERLRVESNAYYKANREACLARCRTYVDNNKEAHAARCAAWYKVNGAAKRSKARAAKLKRTPAWADMDAIKFFYECRPAGCDVDHIIPMQGKNISGLHVETNLQWLPSVENYRKGNRWVESW